MIHSHLPRARRLIALAVICVGLAVAGCGSSSSRPAANDSSPIALSHCMRANGVSNFPDPTAGPGGEGFNTIGLGANGVLVVDGIRFVGPALTKAEKACKQYLPGGGAPPPALTASEQAKIVAQAQCMRTHGVPNFPDPSFSGGSPVKAQVAGNGINPQSPAFQHAVAACGAAKFRVPG